MRFAHLLVFLLAPSLWAAEVRLSFEPRWAGVATAIPSDEFKNESGQAVRLTRFAALVSEVAFTREDGAVVRLPGQFGFVDAADGKLAVELHDVPVGEYTGIQFQFGLPPGVNHGDPGQWPAGHALNPLVNHLLWNWQGGYVFVALEGRWRNGTSPSLSGEEGFSYHVAGDARVMPVRFAARFSIATDTSIGFAIELSRIFRAQHFAVDDGSDNTHSRPGDPVAARVVTAFQHSLFWLGTHPIAASAGRATPQPVSTHHVGRPLSFSVPRGFPAPNLPEDNPLTAEGVELGMALFNDKRLSGNGTQSCADCHSAAHAFSDSVALSRGADGQRGVRNAMPLFNLAWSPSYAWDGSKPRIRDQALAAMTNPIEMHGDPAQVVQRLSADPNLVEKFRAAFGTPVVTVAQVTLALEQFLLTKISADSKFDRAVRGLGELTEQEKEGFALFMTEYDPARGRRGADCFHCHGGPLFTDYDFKNNGLDRVSADAARQGVTGRPQDEGKFKTPSLRNVAVTGPYMHDGRFQTLEEVVAHYDHGVVRSATLDPNLAKHPEDGMKLTTDEQKALVAFLRTLTDSRWEPATPSVAVR